MITKALVLLPDSVAFWPRPTSAMLTWSPKSDLCTQEAFSRQGSRCHNPIFHLPAYSPITEDCGRLTGTAFDLFDFPGLPFDSQAPITQEPSEELEPPKLLPRGFVIGEFTFERLLRRETHADVYSVRQTQMAEARVLRIDDVPKAMRRHRLKNAGRLARRMIVEGRIRNLLVIVYRVGKDALEPGCRHDFQRQIRENQENVEKEEQDVQNSMATMLKRNEPAIQLAKDPEQWTEEFETSKSKKGKKQSIRNQTGVESRAGEALPLQAPNSAIWESLDIQIEVLAPLYSSPIFSL
ncbi:hypothetical protein B0I35DRAFT_445858 [Stachybotrys elegans]|uniref:Uncharacterized protein n=1 Tax=Stachybotrys elegans TaxID=80388 RepID=A0A8K0WJC4_9HYPO|nr:hypothetical protein B0I35DRAFT_445858 [Stachybotrys elegans]